MGGGGGNSDFTVTPKSGLTGRGPYTSVVTVKTSSVTKNITCEKNVAISATKISSKGGQQLHALGTIPTEKTVEGIDYYVSHKFSTNSRGMTIGIIGRMAPLAGMVGYNENLVIYTNLEEKVGIHFNNNFIA
jgi:hypothetical protein